MIALRSGSPVTQKSSAASRLPSPFMSQSGHSPCSTKRGPVALDALHSGKPAWSPAPQKVGSQVSARR